MSKRYVYGVAKVDNIVYNNDKLYTSKRPEERYRYDYNIMLSTSNNDMKFESISDDDFKDNNEYEAFDNNEYEDFDTNHDFDTNQDYYNNNYTKAPTYLRVKSYLFKIIYYREVKHIPIVLFILGILGAFIIDILKILKNLLFILLLASVITGFILCSSLWKKIEPKYNSYNEYAEEVVANASYSDFKLQESSYIYDKDKKLLIKLKADQDSSYIEYKDIPTTFIDAFVAIEDKTFWDNPGIDLKGIARVLYDYVRTEGEEAHGASTITQQLARNIYLTHEVSLDRKAKEILVAMKLTSKFSKEEIMEFYCNDICFANAYYGIGAAAKGYFNKNVKDLSLSQIAYLCAIPNSPEYYNPYKYPERAINRRNKILRDMCSQDLITEEERDEALAEEITIERPESEFNDYLSTYAIDCAVRYMMNKSDFEFRYRFKDMTDYHEYKDNYEAAYAEAKNKLYTGGYKIYTSLDREVQNNLQAILDEQLSFSEEVNEETGIYTFQGAITAIDNRSGRVIAVVGGRSQERDSKTYSLNRAYQAYRQPGSSIKPLVVYTPALMNGYNPNTTVYNIDVDKAKQKGVNAQKLTGPSMTLRSALEQSKNGVAWQIFDRLGADYCVGFLNQMEFSAICPSDYYNSSALGGLTYGVTTVEMASAYATLVNHGMFRTEECITSIINRDGEEIYTRKKAEKVYKVKASDTVVDIMKGVITKGTAKSMGWYNQSDIVAAGKTGTTNNNKDAWFCGFTPYYTVTVWCGYDQPKTMRNLQGATYPAKIWKESMLSLTAEKEPIKEFEKGDSSAEDEEDKNIRAADLPESAYAKYLPGRADDEEIAPGYTVYDYRKDRVTGETVDVVIAQINATLPGDIVTLNNLYSQGCGVVKSLYSKKYSNEKQLQLDLAYNSKLLILQSP